MSSGSPGLPGLLSALLQPGPSPRVVLALQAQPQALLLREARSELEPAQPAARPGPGTPANLRGARTTPKTTWSHVIMNQSVKSQPGHFFHQFLKNKQNGYIPLSLTVLLHNRPWCREKYKTPLLTSEEPRGKKRTWSRGTICQPPSPSPSEDPPGRGSGRWAQGAPSSCPLLRQQAPRVPQ